MDRQKFFKLLDHLSLEDLEQVHVAYWLAKDIHRGQVRDGGERYFEHVREVALVLIRHGITDAETIIKCLLHDLFEDTWTPYFVIRRLFGVSMLNSLIVLSKKVPVFDAKSGRLIRREKVSDEIYYQALATAPKSDRLVKCADRLHNLRSMGVWPREKQVEYALHTQQYAIPLAMQTSEFFTKALEQEVQKVLLLEN